MADLQSLLVIILLAPLLGCLVAGILGKKIGKAGAHWTTCILVGLSFVLSVYIAYEFVSQNLPAFNQNLFTWAAIGHFNFGIGFMVDRLTIFMMVIVNFVSLLVHVYSIGYMKDDPGYQRFFSYISGFTFSMLSLVMANNFLLLFFGWEAVGLVSYLLIGFWFDRESANYASLKAFIANRFGDLGFLLGVAAVLMYFGTIDYASVFQQVPGLNNPHAITLICLLLFAGAVGKSAQIPLHVWLEGSMEGPTPISALIHAATMVTAGVFMIARLSPMFEFSPVALSTVLMIGAATCFFMGILGLVQMDIKRVVAYSTLSQLGYMMAAQGASAFSLGMFHLMTHAGFKALLFLSAGSVIVGMHHEQNMKYMGGLRKYMPVTYVCMLIGALALVAFPPFSGFYSKDLIIEAVSQSTLPGHSIATFFVVGGTFITALYTFRMFFMVFHGKTRMTEEQKNHIHESPLTILIPLILLAIPSVFAGMLFFQPALHNWFGSAIYYAPQYPVVTHLAAQYPTAWQFLLHAFITLPFWLGIAGIVVAWIFYVARPELPAKLAAKTSWLYRFLLNKYEIDGAYDRLFGGGTRVLGWIFWRIGDQLIIDKALVNGSGKTVKGIGAVLRRLQTGMLYHYAFAMIIGLLVILGVYFLMGGL